MLCGSLLLIAWLAVASAELLFLAHNLCVNEGRVDFKGVHPQLLCTFVRKGACNAGKGVDVHTDFHLCGQPHRLYVVCHVLWGEACSCRCMFKLRTCCVGMRCSV
jgi:hypothetical protein